jgi:hypothetical protein
LDLEEVFTAEAITAAGTNVTPAEEERLAELVREYITTNELVITGDEADIVNLAVLMFVGGRTDQASNTRIPIWMSPIVIGQFLEFLSTTPQKE